MVITALTRNQVARKGSWVRIPPLPPNKLPRLYTTTNEEVFLFLGKDIVNITNLYIAKISVDGKCEDPNH